MVTPPLPVQLVEPAAAASPVLPLQAQPGRPYGDALPTTGPRRGPSTSVHGPLFQCTVMSTSWARRALTHTSRRKHTRPQTGSSRHVLYAPPPYQHAPMHSGCARCWLASSGNLSWQITRATRSIARSPQPETTRVTVPGRSILCDQRPIGQLFWSCCRWNTHLPIHGASATRFADQPSQTSNESASW